MKIKVISILLASLFCVMLLASCGGNSDTDSSTTIENLNGKTSQGLAYATSEANPNEVIITGMGTCTDKNIVVPSTIDGKRVVGVANGAFRASSEASPRTGSRMGRAALVAEESGDSSDGVVFEEYNGSSTITPLNPTYTPVNPNYAFEADDGEAHSPEEILSVTLPSTVTEIGAEAFLGCESLATISTGSSISSIGKDAFKDTAYFNNQENWENHALYISNYLITVDSSYTGEFTIKEGTTIIADQAFYQCVNITSVNMAQTVTYTGSYTFYGCSNLTFINGAGQSIFGSGAFDGCISYKDFVPSYPNGGEADENGSTNDEPSKPETLYDELTPEIFNAVKNEGCDVFTAVIMRGADTRETYKSNMGEYYYACEENGTLVREMYAQTDENGLVNYMRIDGKWYFTTANFPMMSFIPAELEFDMLHVINEEDNLYGYYLPENPGARIEIGIKNGRLIYLCYQFPDQQVRIDFIEFKKTTINEYFHADFVPGVWVDANGNQI